MISLTTEQLKEIIDLEFAIRETACEDEIEDIERFADMEEKLNELWHYHVLDSFADDISVDINELDQPFTDYHYESEALSIRCKSLNDSHSAEIAAYIKGVLELIPEYAVTRAALPHIIYVKKA